MIQSIEADGIRVLSRKNSVKWLVSPESFLIVTWVTR